MAIVLLVAPIQSALMMVLFYEDRTAIGVFGVVYFCLGKILKLGLSYLRTNLRLGLRLVEWCFYLGSASTLSAFAYMCFSNLGNVLIMAICIFAVKKTINEIKIWNISDQQGDWRSAPRLLAPTGC